MQIQKSLFVAFFALSLVGCQKELERFGYSGRDLEEEGELLPLVTGTAVTNMVPARLLSVYETYEFTEREKKALAALGVIQPGEPLAEIPSGYVARTVEPWFTFWIKETEVFGEKGTIGFMAHFNLDKKAWETGEVFYSTYHESMDEARAAFARRERAFVKECKPLKLHRLSGDLVVAEYRRLRVISIVGRRADGVITCMTSVIDKCREGCGPWMPLDEQREALADERYVRLRAAWRADCARLSDENHKAVQEVCATRSLSLFGAEAEAPNWLRVGGYRYAAQIQKSFDGERDDLQLKAIFDEHLRRTAVGFGLDFTTGVMTNQIDESCTEWSAVSSNDLFDVHLAMDVSRRGGKADDESETSETNALRVTVSVLAVERFIGGRVLPKEPVRPEL